MNKLKDFMIRRRYSPRTIEVYTSLVGSYLSILKKRDPADIKDEEIYTHVSNRTKQKIPNPLDQLEL